MQFASGRCVDPVAYRSTRARTILAHSVAAHVGKLSPCSEDVLVKSASRVFSALGVSYAGNLSGLAPEIVTGHLSRKAGFYPQAR